MRFLRALKNWLKRKAQPERTFATAFEKWNNAGRRAPTREELQHENFLGHRVRWIRTPDGRI